MSDFVPPKKPRPDKKNSHFFVTKTPEERKAWGDKMAALKKQRASEREILRTAPKPEAPFDPRPASMGGPKDRRYQFVPQMEEHKLLIDLKEPGADGRRQGPFVANNFQRILDDSVTPNDLWHLILKPRQVGISTYEDLRLLEKCLTVHGTRAAIISHEIDATTRLLRKVHLALADLVERKVKINGKVVKTKYSSKYEISFPDTNSWLYIGTAGKRAFSRGDSLTDVHASEIAFWANAGALMTGLVGALVSTAEVWIESTANGMGGYFYDMVKKCEGGVGPAKLHFFPWQNFPEYSQTPPAGVIWSGAETDLARRFNLTPGQLWWRRCKMAKYETADEFFQEFPMTIDEAFIVSGSCFFEKESLREMTARARRPLLVGSIESVGTRAVARPMEGERAYLSVYEHPRLDRSYIIGVDGSEGVEGGDPMSACVLDRERCSEAAWISGLLDPLEAAKALYALGQFYNWAWIAVEDGSAGIAILSHLVTLGYPRLFRRTDPTGDDPKPKLGFRTDAKTRPLALGALRSMMKTRVWGCASAQFLRQATTFVRHNDGGYRASSGCHDDDIMAAAICAFLHQRLPVDATPAEQERESRILGPSGQPIKFGHKTGY
jgi:hypothetical protein